MAQFVDIPGFESLFEMLDIVSHFQPIIDPILFTAVIPELKNAVKSTFSFRR